MGLVGLPVNWVAYDTAFRAYQDVARALTR